MYFFQENYIFRIAQCYNDSIIGVKSFRTARYNIGCKGKYFLMEKLMSDIRFHDAQIFLLQKVEVGNFALQACNVREKEHICEGFREILIS